GRVLAAENQAVFFERSNVRRIDFIAMAKPQADSRGVIEELADLRTGLEVDIFASQAHVSAQAFDLFLFGEDINDRTLAFGIEFGAVRINDSADIAGELDNRHLKTQA